jgi:uncharacterized protein YndB with AHSA1/START domain
MTERRQTPERETRSAQGQVEINASPERVWRALTDAGELERWFPLDARVEPGPGGTIWMSWRNEFAGAMKILVWDPPRHLQTSWSFHEADQPAQITDYVLETRQGKTVLRAVTSGFPLDASWDNWVEGTNRGWAFELRSLKHYLERHAGETRHVVYLRRRIPLTNVEGWARLQGPAGLGAWLAGGEPFDRRPALQYAAVVSDPPDALFRVSIEPGAGPASNERDVVLWLSAWGDQERRTAQIRTEWTSLLERLYPEGTALA